MVLSTSSEDSLRTCSDSRQLLIRLMQQLNFGRIEGLAVRGGRPVFDPPPRIIREVKFGAENGPRPEAGRADFALKAQVRELFAQLEELGDGVVRCIEIQRGLPFRMIVEEVPA